MTLRGGMGPEGSNPLRRGQVPILSDGSKATMSLGKVRLTSAKRVTGFRTGALATALLIIGSLSCSLPLTAQEEGPLGPAAPKPEPQLYNPPVRPPEPATERRPSTPHATSPITKDPPSIPVEQIIQQFAAREAEFRVERENFTYVQTFVVQTIDDGGRVDGEYRLTSDVTFTPSGKRYEEVTYAPQPTLERIMLSKEDFDDLRNVQPFVLVTEDLPKYNITYVGRQQLDEIGTYIFDVAPKTIEKNQRYFQGRIWVDDRDLEIVKTYGKAVPDIHKGNNENVFPRFETYRENIEGHFWFPTYTHADDVLNFKTGGVHIRMTVLYSDYKRFRVSVRLLPPPPGTPPPDQTPKPPPPPATH